MSLPLLTFHCVAGGSWQGEDVLPTIGIRDKAWVSVTFMTWTCMDNTQCSRCCQVAKCNFQDKKWQKTLYGQWNFQRKTLLTVYVIVEDYNLQVTNHKGTGIQVQDKNLFTCTWYHVGMYRFILRNTLLTSFLSTWFLWRPQCFLFQWPSVSAIQNCHPGWGRLNDKPCTGEDR